MRAWLDTFAVTAQIAFRNLFASRLKTIIVGGIIFFGAFLVVLGTSLLDSVVGAMSRSITGSVAGHVQASGGTELGGLHPPSLAAAKSMAAPTWVPLGHARHGRS